MCHSPVWTLRWALRWDDLPYIFPQPGKGQQCLFSGDSCLADAALFLPRLSPTFTRRLPRSTFSCAPASPPLTHLLPPAMLLGLHLFKSNKIIATISKVLLSWFSFNVSSAWPDGRLGKTSTSDITASSPIQQNRRSEQSKVIIGQIGYNNKCVVPPEAWLTIHTCRLQCDYSANAALSWCDRRVDKANHPLGKENN